MAVRRQFTANIGRAPNTVTAYGRALEDHLRFCALVGADPLTIRADVIAAWIGDLHERPKPRTAKLVRLDSGTGLANATIQQYVIAVRSFYEFLVEGGLRERTQCAAASSDGGAVAPGRAWCAEWRTRHGSPMNGIGRRSSGPPVPSRYATGSCSPWLTTVRCAVRNWSTWRSATSSPPTV
ncbi:site-specific integrase [Nonomuraea sp. NPDC050786]|uniref:site-specific integrase n=1 Tax=Nonomuraea sp. NPDC050786 TaxID=3154840 RepID=UPI0033E43D07